ncbi:hypothetical protein [Streptomyces reniochalinae]|uniref:Uncharacterized protein n=1 Tax=Streptomyces reniochalinae TaxID=2250578 RepID=A0A367EWH7_9ACTN|nr:hypothetical protein [Streptomyces reniochalinae]RCG21727.1 hypothetical protein DQ392_08430 [Streptomyces reniochalinae]
MAYYAHFWRNFEEYRLPFDTVDDAVDYLREGSDASTLSVIDVLDEDGTVVLEGDSLSDAFRSSRLRAASA